MKYYIIGYTFNEFLIGDVLVPKKVYTEEEKARGKKNFTEVSDKTLEALRTNNVFNALESTKKLRVLDKLPGWAVSGGEREAALQAQTKELTAKNSELAEALAAKDVEKQAIVDEATLTIDDLRKEIAKLKGE